MRKTVTLLLILLVPASQSVPAADWRITQTANISSPTFGMNQADSASSRQAVNGIGLGTDDSLSSVNQQTTYTETDITLDQGGTATQNGEPVSNSNIQTINLASAPSIIELEQTVEGFKSATLTQDATGSGNIQALNYAQAEESIANANQTVIGDSITLTRAATTPTGNIQAVNYMKAQRYTGTVNQSLALENSLVVNNSSSSSTDIRINSINGDTSAALSVTQTAKMGNVNIDATDFPTIILNHMAP